ncbi:hypothetical protein [Ktedonobacter sp. SOSP1-52]|uniref:hypothetical protein n=1 Tax=Ktedonobacter sp. SOSP1-52 TaxID=2778366 RepID=UPI0019155AC8|nr:hypothetical protein [Ktedonobacter sp. SOSP1-52]
MALRRRPGREGWEHNIILVAFLITGGAAWYIAYSHSFERSGRGQRLSDERTGPSVRCQGMLPDLFPTRPQPVSHVLSLLLTPFSAWLAAA